MRPRFIAVTGGIACGKSTLSGFLSELGCGILDTDEVSHQLQGAQGTAVEAIADRFGADVISLGGSVKRKTLGKVVFADPKALADLEAIMHPLIEQEVVKWIARRPDGSLNAVLVPLLFEAGYDRKFRWDATVAVVCSREVQMERLLRRGLSESEARARVEAQMSCEEKARRADFAIMNDGSKATLLAEAERLLEAVSRLPTGD